MDVTSSEQGRYFDTAPTLLHTLPSSDSRAREQMGHRWEKVSEMLPVSADRRSWGQQSSLRDVSNTLAVWLVLLKEQEEMGSCAGAVGTRLLLLLTLRRGMGESRVGRGAVPIPRAPRAKQKRCW